MIRFATAARALCALALALALAAAPAPADAAAPSSLAAHQTIADAPRPPQAAGTFELGALLGLWWPSLASGLGDAYFRYDVPGLTSIFGLRAGWQATRRLAVEGEVRYGRADLRSAADFERPLAEKDADAWSPGGTADVGSIRAGVRLDILDRGPVYPFVRALVGVDLAASDKAFFGGGWDSDWAAGVGVGTRLRLSHRLRLRVDVDAWLGEPAVARELDPAGGPGVNVSATAGASWIFGGPEADEDVDGVPDAVDQCPDDPEDKDGFADADGCPDLDNDGDAIPDVKDRCPLEAEDDDGFEDSDGCPDLDNDGDGIPDADDKCPDAAEDKDGFEDADGCPDPDNDGDGIPDAEDRCPLEAEDKDGFADDDGCPDPDDDGDGVPDAQDRCPREKGSRDDGGCPSDDPDHDGLRGAADRCPDEAETYNGVADDDGCPDEPALVSADASGITLLEPIAFRGKRIDKASAPIVAAIATLMSRFGWTRLSVEVHGDDRDAGAKGRARTAARAATVRDAIVALGVAPERVDARGYGDARPICRDIAALLAAKPRDKAAVAACRANNARIELRVPSEPSP